MNIEVLQQAIVKEQLLAAFYIKDYRTKQWQEQRQQPYTVILNIVAENQFDVYGFDEKGFKSFSNSYSTESEACAVALNVLRENTKEIREYLEAMQKKSRGFH